MALRQFAQDGNLKWVSLMMWAGADPRSTGPTVEDPDEWSTTALHEACWSDNVGVVKRLQPTPSDDLAGMLHRASERATADIMGYLLTIGAKPNDKADGGSSALDSCLRILGWEDLDRVEHGDFAIYEDSPQKTSRARPAIRVLLRHGAIWTPDLSTLNATRRILYRLEPDLLVELLAQLRDRETGDAALRELLRVRRLEQFLAFCERWLKRFGSGQTTDQRDARKGYPTPRRTLTKDDRWRVYDAVWSKPVAKVARRYGMSAVDLLRGCRELDIPTPPRGYWTKKKAGEPVPRRPRLPALKGPAQ
jgi:hypothetical protein